MLVKKNCICKKVLEGSCHIKILKVLWAILDCLGNVGLAGVEKAGECFVCIR